MRTGEGKENERKGKNEGDAVGDGRPGREGRKGRAKVGEKKDEGREFIPLPNRSADPNCNPGRSDFANSVFV